MIVWESHHEKSVEAYIPVHKRLNDFNYSIIEKVIMKLALCEAKKCVLDDNLNIAKYKKCGQLFKTD